MLKDGRILIVDDVPDVRLLLRASIGRRFPGVQIDEAESGRQASTRLEGSAYRIVISDQEMPDGTGSWLYQFMCEHCPKTPLLIFTSNPDRFCGQIGGTLRAIIPKTDLPSVIAELEKACRSKVEV